MAQEKERVSTNALSELTRKLAFFESQYEEEHNLVLKLSTEVETAKLDEKKNSMSVTRAVVCMPDTLPARANDCGIKR